MYSAVTKFSHDVFLNLENDKNVIFSPLSIYFALSIATDGATGKTFKEMTKTLFQNKENYSHDDVRKLMTYFEKLNEKLEGRVTPSIAKIANKLYVDIRIKLNQSFLDNSDKSYSASVESASFSSNLQGAIDDINKWIAAQTNGKIKDLLNPSNTDKDTGMIIINALYFKGQWITKFHECPEKLFKMSSGQSKSLSFMELTDKINIMTDEANKFRVAKLAFQSDSQNGRYDMLIVLPNEGVSLDKLSAKLVVNEHELLHNILLSTNYKTQQVHMEMPKFRVEYQIELNDVLQKLGIVSAFDIQQADFTKMTTPDSPDLFISKVVHKAFIEVDENGVEAAAATAVVMMMRCGIMIHKDPIDFIVDRPFLFFVTWQENRDQLNLLPLFSGQFIG